MQVLIAVLSFIDIVALTFLNGYWVHRLPLSLSLQLTLLCLVATHRRFSLSVCL